ncbi:MAG TPA: 50S ribosomal protein L13 [Planctomycetota bacterium]|jgi:large subunit ribosomal protein L13|nr:50S ribosomal protein L13 [Planctomycetota bacterium]
MNRTISAKAPEVPRRWFLVDASVEPLGRMAARVARVLMGKHRPLYTPHVDTGEFVVVVNASRTRLTGKKAAEKIYQRYSGYPGGRKEVPYPRFAAKDPTRPVRVAVAGMLPKGPLGKRMARKLKVYAGPDHPHSAQGPKPLPA